MGAHSRWCGRRADQYWAVVSQSQKAELAAARLAVWPGLDFDFVLRSLGGGARLGRGLQPFRPDDCYWALCCQLRVSLCVVTSIFCPQAPGLGIERILLSLGLSCRAVRRCVALFSARKCALAALCALGHLCDLPQLHHRETQWTVSKPSVVLIGGV